MDIYMALICGKTKTRDCNVYASLNIKVYDLHGRRAKCILSPGVFFFLFADFLAIAKGYFTIFTSINPGEDSIIR